ncbi:hypothetical protein [Methanolapillus millepedarum]|uniref:hypothetical protein n=1 Tax=Methanolapillus millepedarum TaxID=3028296 RepID=UPI0030B91278
MDRQYLTKKEKEMECFEKLLGFVYFYFTVFWFNPRRIASFETKYKMAKKKASPKSSDKRKTTVSAPLSESAVLPYAKIQTVRKI